MWRQHVFGCNASSSQWIENREEAHWPRLTFLSAILAGIFLYLEHLGITFLPLGAGRGGRAIPKYDPPFILSAWCGPEAKVEKCKEYADCGFNMVLGG